MSILLKILKGLGIALGAVLLALIGLLLIWYLRPNRAVIEPGLELETWSVVDDGAHNSNTDMIYWNDAFYLIYASSPFHFASEESRLNLLRSTDGRAWELVAQFDASGEDIRDPKLAVIHGRLFLYALKNVAFTAEPYATVYAVSEDAVHWTNFEAVQPEGWLFWRPETLDGSRWFVPAYWREHGRAALLASDDGIAWEMLTQIYEGDRIDETAIAFLPDGRMLATGRLEVSDSFFGDPQGSTLISVSPPPYTDWSASIKSTVARLDGPYLFVYNGQVYAVGRFQPNPRPPFTMQGSIFSRKRTALYLVQEDKLIHLSDLPSAGDTSYAGVVIRGDDLYVCYYTSDIHRDYAWVLGMVLPSSIEMAKVDLPSLESLAAAKSVP